ncbi:MAG TPA: polysaccharide deacetylase family protein, partial [Polyangiaceae bacterium]
MRLCAISVDLDEIPNYWAIHGLDPASGSGRGLTAVYDVAVGRLLDLAEEERIPLTLFAIGSDLVRTENADTLRAAHVRGHEIANHTLDHRYDLTRLGRDDMAHQIEGGITAIAHAVGET